MSTDKQEGMTIEQGNKLIAEFDGKTPVSFLDKSTNCVFEGWVWIENGKSKQANYLKYHSSWDWLMPVVEKIEKLGYDSRIHGNDSDGGYLCDFVDAENMEVACVTNYES